MNMLPNNRIDLKFQEQADPRSLGWLEKISNSLTQLTSAIRSIRFDLPNVFKVAGIVSVDRVGSLPPVEVKNLSEMSAYFNSLSTSISQWQQQTIKAIQALKLNSPDSVQVANALKVEGIDDVVESLEEVKKGFNLLLKKDFGGGTGEGPLQVEIIKDLPRLYPNPVTNVSINPVRGTVSSTAVTVTSALTPLPAASLMDRRSMTIYNNSSTTIYLGGSTVSVASGTPVLGNTWGPSLDVGPANIVYAVTNGGSADVRVLEMNDLQQGGDD